jgi:LacI family transcriptional regulator
MAVTIADIAKTVGVHQSTVSTVLNKSRSTIRISEKTRKKIFETAQQLNYRPSFSAQALARGKTFSIGMTCGSIHSPHYSELASHAMQEVEAHGYHLLLSVTQWLTMENNLDCLETLMSRGVDGIISWGTSLQPGTSLYEHLVREKFPIALCGENVGQLSSIDSEWGTGMNETVAYLSRKGHSHICFVGYAGKPEDENNDPKWVSLLKACSRYGVKASASYLKKLSNLEEAEEFGMKAAHQADRATAFLVYSDYVAFGFLRGLLNQGLRIPQEVAVVGIDGTKMGKYFHPSLTTIAQEREQIVAKAIEMVLGMIDKKQEPGQKVIFPTKLIIRESA